jgi:hypothetical protein
MNIEYELGCFDFDRKQLEIELKTNSKSLKFVVAVNKVENVELGIGIADILFDNSHLAFALWN